MSIWCNGLDCLCFVDKWHWKSSKFDKEHGYLTETESSKRNTESNMMVRQSVQASTTNIVASEGDELHRASPRQKVNTYIGEGNHWV